MPRSPLTDDDVRLIKQLLAERDEYREKARSLGHEALAEKFGVGAECIKGIDYGRTWTHVVEGDR